MAQKILAARTADPTLAGEIVVAKVDQVVLARAPMRAMSEALAAGLRKTSVEVAIAYDGRCVTRVGERAEASDAPPLDVMGHGVLVARAGMGYPAPVHLERFASPARLCVTDEPRLAAVGGIGMLAIVVSPAQLGTALVTGTIALRPPRSVQVLLSGRTRPFVCARDVALELVRCGLGDVVRRVEEAKRAPVVVEFAGPSVRLLSVAERAVLAGIAPQIGAAAAIFVSDERTEVFLRDQRRSKAHRALVPDAGAPCDDVLNVDLAAVDPLVEDEEGRVRAARELAGKRVTQVLLGGDTGATLRDFFAAAALLKSKRVPSHVDLLLAVPSRQSLEVLSSSGALTDLIATGARLVEPDARVVDGTMYPPPAVGGAGVRTCDSEPRPLGEPRAIVASAETVACAVATGEMGDPRSFKRPVRVTVPRTLPTDDVLVARERRASERAATPSARPVAKVDAPAWRGALTLEVVEAGALVRADAKPNGATALGVVCASLEEVRQVAARAADVAAIVRAVIAPHIPSGTVALFSGVGIAALRADAAALKAFKGQRTLALPAPAHWSDGPTQVTFGAGGGAAGVTGVKGAALTWLALGAERAWVRGERDRAGA
jgi:aconitate hydratase